MEDASIYSYKPDRGDGNGDGDGDDEKNGKQTEKSKRIVVERDLQQALIPGDRVVKIHLIR